MLFDLRSRGRRRTVQGIYLLLAVIMGGGLIFFGIGGGTNGGLFDALGGGSSSSSSNAFQDRADSARKAVTARPQDAKAWAALAKARYELASVGDNFDQTSGAYTAKGRAMLQQAGQAWQRYLALNPKHPDPSIAALMVRAYDMQALNQPAQAARAQEIVVGSQNPSSGQYAQLAVYAYLAGEDRQGQLAEQKALELEKDPARRKQLKAAIEQAKQASSAAGQQVTNSAGGAPSG